LVVTQGVQLTLKNSAVVNAAAVVEAFPAGVLDGINYNSTDATKATGT
jgi:hypothetical protein